MGGCARPQKKCLVALEFFQTVFWHHSSGLLIELAAPRKLIPLETEPMFSTRRFQDTDTFRNNFLPNAVAGNSGDTITFHPYSLARREGVSMSITTPSRR